MAMMEIKPDIKYTVYQQLALIPPEIADKITNAKTGGGRSLNAIHDSKLSQIEKHLLLVLGSELNFCKEFANQYRFISLNALAEKLSVDKRTISALLNGTKRKGKIIDGLINKGYVNKQIATLEEQEKGWANHYCITTKIFDEYIITLIEKYKKQDLTLPSDPGSPPLGSKITPPSDPGSHKDPSYKDPSLTPSLNAEAQPAAAKRKKPKLNLEKSTKMKPWEKKSEEERMNTVLNMVCDAHRLSIEKDRRVKPFPFDDIPDLLLPILKIYGTDSVKAFLEKRREENRGCNVRILGQEILRGMDKKLDENEPNLEIEIRQEKLKEKTFPDNVVLQMERNMNFDKKIMNENKEIVLDDFPQDVQDWYKNISDMKFKKNINKEFKVMSKEQFIAFVASILNRNKRDDFNNANKTNISMAMG